ncbi:MAG: DUF4325 domain-containing protein [bacterium]
MKIDIIKFGEILISRPAGKEAFLAAKAYLLKALQPREGIIIDFAGVKVLSPSWADEFITQIKQMYKKNKITFLNITNPSVKATLAAIK